MADDPMLGLFDSDTTSFLDELTAGGPNNLPTAGHGMPGSMPGSNGGMMPMGSMQQLPSQGESYIGAMQGQHHPQQNYSQMSAMTPAQPQFSAMSSQASMLPQQYNNMGYNQYGSSSKLHHMSSSMVGGGQGSTLMGQSPPQQVQQQFASPPPSSPRMQRAQVQYQQSYGMHGGPRMPAPGQQQMTMPQQNSNWNPNPTANQMSYLQQQRQQQPQQQGMMARGVPQMSNYMPQHDYGISNSQQMSSRLSHFPDQSNATGQIGGGVMQGLGSPSANMSNRLTHIPMSSPNSMNMLHTRPQVQQYPATSQTMSAQGNVNMNSYTSQTQALQCMPGDFMQKGPQVVNSGAAAVTPAGTSKLQHYAFQTSPQNQTMPTAQGMNEAPPLTHYPNQSPSQNSPHGQYQQTYSSGGPRGPIPSPRPTPPPPSHTPTERLTSPQGSLQQSGMQQFAGTNQSAVNPFQTRMPSAPSPGASMVMPPRQPSNVASYQSMGFPSNTNMNLGVSTTVANSGIVPGQASPTFRPHHQGVASQQDINVEIQQLQQQVKQLYSMPQTQQSQQTMLDLQERMRMLKAQQQQQILQIQQKRQQQQMMMMQQQPPSQMAQGQSVMVSQPMKSPMSQQQVSPSSPRKPVSSQPPLQTMATQVPITTLTSSPSHHPLSQAQAPLNAPPQPGMPQPQVPTSQSLPQQKGSGHTAPVIHAQQPSLSSLSNLSSPMASLVQLTDQQMTAQQQPPFSQLQQTAQNPAPPEQRSPSLALAASTPSVPKPEPQQALELPLSGQQPVIQTSTHQDSPLQASPSLSLQLSQMQPLQDLPGLPFHPQLQGHQPLQPTEEEVIKPQLNISDDQMINVTSDQSPVKSAEPSPEKKKKKRTKKKVVELGPDGEPLPKTPKVKSPKVPRKKKTKDAEKSEAPAVSEVVTQTPIETSAVLDVPPLDTPPAIPIMVNEIVEGALDETDTVNVTDVSGAEPIEGDMDVKKTPPKKKKSKKDAVPKEKKEKKEKKPKTPKARPSKKKPPATFLKKKKKKGGTGSDNSDLDATPPPSPQNEEDSGIQKRRSARNTGTKRKKYLDELELNLSEEEAPEGETNNLEGPATMRPVQFFVDNPNEEDAVVVEKILGMRIRRRDKDEMEANEEEEEEEEEEFYVKYKNFSYLHCEWRTVKELERDKRIQMKIKRYRMKRLAQNNYFAEVDDEELFNPDYVEVDRVLDVSVTTDPVSEEEVTHFLVKWRSLPYEESTWELQQDVDPLKVQLFNKFKDCPPEEERELKERPKKGDEWTKLEESRTYKNNNTLREYQLEGLNWLTFSWYNGRNCILADEMGLGKTIQSLTFSNEMYLYGIKGPFLVVAPLSTIANWQREYETWTDMNVITYHGSTPSRIMIQEYEMFYKDENGHRIPDVYRFHVLITTYEIIIADYDVLSQIDWRVAIIDEAHRLKNRNCQLLERLKHFDIEHRVLLTGTPLQNNVEELFSLLNFLEPKTFSSSQAFMAEFGELKSESQVDKLKAILKPMMLRRLKEDVEKNLAPKEETIVEVELTNIQKKYYRAILERNFSFLAKGSGSATNVPNLMNTMMELRKCCNHPYLIKGAEEKILEEVREKHGTDTEHVFNALVQSCGKLVLIDKLLPKLQQDGHKILIFSQMIRVLDILEDYCVNRKYLYERLDGRIRGNIRQEAIDRFSKPDSDRFVFLLCTRAGGLGINLTAADTVIIFDSDWNPQNDLQAQARCHRIGQSRSVKVYRLITRNTYEREMFDKASMKLGLDKAVLQSMGGEKTSAQAGSAMSKKDVEELLRKGAYGALMDDDNAGDKFCEEDIEQILQRRTQVIQIESEGKGSTFAKASFSASGNRSDISIDDPNFWQKWAKKADLDVDELTNRNDLILEEPRQRRQTTRYGNQDNVVDMSDLESSSDTDEEGGLGRRGRRGKKRRNRDPKDDDFEAPEDGVEGRYTRAECFRVEKNLLVYGWGRWSDILAHGRFKRKLSEKDVETISRALLAYSLQFYKGDERIKGFIWDLVSPDNDAALKNHSGLSAPVPRGRKGKKMKKEIKHMAQPTEFDRSSLQLNFEEVLTDGGYKRHLQRHSNKVLLRVRLLYYLKQEVIGEEADKVFMGYPSCDIDIPPPGCDGDPPTFWWDEESDRSLLVGVFKHGYEKYNLMRQDPCLVFLSRCGPPDGAAVLAEQNDEENDDFMDVTAQGREDDDDEDSLAPEMTPKKLPLSVLPPEQLPEGGYLPFPSISELNTRLRRVVTGYQRNHKKEQLRMAQRAKRMERRERTELVIKERELKKRESQQNRWSRREEADFYRTVSTFGVEMHKGQYIWDRFRCIARLDKKYDETLTEYFLAFYHMCKAVCKRFKDEEEAAPPNNIYVEPITEERANRCLNRIDLLSRIRQETLHHPKLDERLKLCQPSFDMPEWWICGKHDKDLLIGAARHGLARTDYHILHDPTLCFQEVIQCKTSQLYGANRGLRSFKGPSSVKGEDEDEYSRDEGQERKIPPTETPWVKTEVKEEASETVLKQEPEEEMEVDTTEEQKGDSMAVDESKDKQVKDDSNGKDVNNEDIVEKKEANREDAEEAKCPKDEPRSPIKSEVEEKSVCENTNGEVVESEKSSEMEGNLVIDMSTDAKTEEGSEKEESKSEEIKEVKEELTEDSEENKSEKKPKDSENVDQKEAEVKKSEDSESVKEEPKQEKMEEELPFSKPLLSQEPVPYPGLEDGGLNLENLGKEATVAELLARSVHNSSIQWPKDKVIFHRLEHVCFTIENGEWPLMRRSYLLAGGDSRSATPVGASTPKSESLAGDHSLSDAPDSAVEGFKVNMVDDDDDEVTRDISVHVSQNDGLKMTFHKRRRRRKLEIEEERARLQQLMNQSAMSSDGESQGEVLNFSSTPVRGQTPVEKLVNGSSPRLDESAMMAQALAHAHAQAQAQAHVQAAHAHAQAQAQAAHAHALAQAQARLGEPVKKRRGRKRKADKIAELEAAARAAAMIEAERQVKRQAMEAALSAELRVPVINLEDGSRLSGSEAPRRHELEKWLDEHPGYMVDRHDMMEEYLQLDMQEALGKRRGRRPRVDPSKLDAGSLTGEENVSVINRETGKKITGAKAPPLKYLAEWLQQNPMFDVDPKWGELVRAKGNLPKSMESRVLVPSERRRRSKEIGGYPAGMLGDFPFPIMSSMGGLSAASLANAGLMANFPKLPLNVPFGALPNLGMANPMLGLGGFGLPGIPVSTAAAAAVASMSESAEDEKQFKESKSGEKDHKSPSKSSAGLTPHPSFPIMYNPLLYNPLFAQGLRNFTLPPNLPTSFASLAQAGLSNGMPDLEQEEEGEVKHYDQEAQNEAQDLSVRHTKDKKTVREKLEELRARQKEKERHNRDKVEKKRSRVSDIVQDLTMKKRSTSPEKAQDLSVKPKEPKPNRIIDKCNKSKVEGKLERLVAKLKAVDKTKSSASSASSTSSCSAPPTATSSTFSAATAQVIETSTSQPEKSSDSEKETPISDNSSGVIEPLESETTKTEGDILEPSDEKSSCDDLKGDNSENNDIAAKESSKDTEENSGGKPDGTETAE